MSAKRALLTLPGSPGKLPLAYSRRLPSEPSSVTLIRGPNGELFVSFVVDVPNPEPLPNNDVHTGVDPGSDVLAAVVGSDGTREKVEGPRFLRNGKRGLRRKQKTLSRKEKESSNRSRARIAVARAHRTVRDARAHTLSLRLVRENQTIGLADTNVKGLAGRSRKAARAATSAQASTTPRGAGSPGS